MKKILSYIICALAAVVLAGCAKEVGIDNTPDGKGRFLFNMKLNGEVLTRAEAPENCVIKIANSGGVLYKYENIADVPAELWLLSGSYTVTVEGGTKVASGWNTPYYKGSETFVIRKGEKTPVTVDCLIQNTLFAVGFESSVTSMLTDYSVTLFPDPNDPSTTLVFGGNNLEAVGYVILERDQTTIDWKFTAKHSVRGAVTKTGTMTGLQPRKKYQLSFKYTILSGGLEVDLKVDETLVECKDDFVIFQRPKVSGVGFDLVDRQLPADVHEILMAASSEITSIALSGSVFGDTPYELLGGANIPADRGVQVEVIDAAKIGVKFLRALFNTMPAGSNHIAITVTDINGKQSTAEFSVMTSGIDAVERNSVWIRRATLKGLVLESGVTTVRFGYRQLGSDVWEYMTANNEPENWYSANLTNLVSGTDYQACIEIDDVLGDPVSFTTESEFELPNGGFEDWVQVDPKKAPWYPFATEESAFWDTANGGLGTMNITSRNYDDIRVGSPGKISVKMESSTYLRKFAAGNLYTGRFAGITFSPMGANVKFGREINSRPSALKGWYKAAPAIVTHDNPAKVPALVMGESTDVYQIYAMLVDWDGPKTVNPGNPASLIDFSADYVIAYGEKSGSTQVTEWKEFTIPMIYRSNKVPTRIVIVACASRYGDYFVGAEGSVLQVDDFELVYDDTPIFQ